MSLGDVDVQHGGACSHVSEIQSATEEQALEMIKESMQAAEGESDYDASATHIFIVLGASVSLCM